MKYNSGSNQASNFKSAERVARGRFEITSLVTPELYDTKSYYQLIVPITKCENLSLGIFINIRNTFQSKKNDWFQLWMWKPDRGMKIISLKSVFLIMIHFRQYLNKMREFLKVMELVTIFSLILIGYHVPCGEISLASGICFLIFIGSLTVRFDLSDYKLLVIGQVKSDSFGVT